jgi:hypothetical protein
MDGTEDKETGNAGREHETVSNEYETDAEMVNRARLVMLNKG